MVKIKSMGWVWPVATVLIVVVLIAINALSRSGNANQQSPTPPAGGLPVSVSNPILAGSVLHYLDNQSGRFASFDLAARSSQTYHQFPIDSKHIQWSSDGSKILYSPSNDTSTSVLSINDGVVTPLNSQIQTPAWSGDGKQILYQFVDNVSGRSMLTIANADGSNWQDIVAVPAVYKALWWSPLKTYAIGLDRSGDLPRYDLIAISSKKVTKLAPGNGSVRWSPSGQKALFDSVDGRSLEIVTLSSGVIDTLGIAGTVDQFTWKDETHLAGVSEGKFVSVDLSSKKATAVPNTDQPTDSFQAIGIYGDKLVYLQDASIHEVSLPK